MALRALNLQVPALEHKVGLRVIERFLIERGKIPVATFMLGMARLALALFDVLDPAVRASFFYDVIVNIFVAVEAQLVLFVGLEIFMTFVALFFVTRMRFRQIPRPEQRFDRFFGAGNGMQGKRLAYQKQQQREP